MHPPLLDKLTVNILGEEFANSPFHGQLYDFIVRIGQGFMESENDLKSLIYYSKIPDL